MGFLNRGGFIRPRPFVGNKQSVRIVIFFFSDGRARSRRSDDGCQSTSTCPHYAPQA